MTLQMGPVAQTLAEQLSSGRLCEIRMAPTITPCGSEASSGTITPSGTRA
eukprot:CAMPEP_0181172870 /NCGR_PEP_ID=MMETSP1096-20121128/2682_1 /TAXON_ID=156174 ORGANISM="Chrysochromulina ericina, Strain CCMP281" /NCGR_SAMPLE_ID=MMETSP1096 /ASSEMBLY_ACC=CAM_ASM_000453 /LENGTH=49 /DNA_ID=CAMNT_0023260631 /DNA_START=636 /DNA_END=785 /DNA_ORIENTATION=-